MPKIKSREFYLNNKEQASIPILAIATNEFEENKHKNAESRYEWAHIKTNKYQYFIRYT